MKEKYRALVDAFYQAIIKKEDKYIKLALELSSDFDAETVEEAKREAAVMSVIDSKFQA